MDFFVFILIIICFSFFFNEVQEADDPIWHIDPLGDERRSKAQAYQEVEEEQRRRLDDDRQGQVWG